MATALAAPIPCREEALSGARARWVALACIAASLLVQLELAYAKSINWDEFYHLSVIHSHLRGEPVQLLQTPFVWLFGWVPGLGVDQIDQIRLIRVLQLPFELVTLAALYGLARRFAAREAALLCVLTYVTGGWVFLHALSLRADPFATALLMTALWLAVCHPQRGASWLAAAGLLAIAFIATIKSALYAPAFLGAAWVAWRGAEGRTLLIRSWLPVAAALAVASAVLLLLASAELPEVVGLLEASLERMFSGALFPQSRYLAMQVTLAPFAAYLMATATLEVRHRPQQQRLLLVSLMALLLWTVVYRNAFPYFFVFILPPVVAAAAPAAAHLIARFGLVPLSLLLLANAAVLSLLEDRSVIQRQAVVQQGLREIFPQPVTYIDESGMLADYPRAVPHYASGWALAGYLAAGNPSYTRALSRETVPLLVLNGDTLLQVYGLSSAPGRLLPADESTLRDNFIPHWGGAFVAGKVVPASSDPLELEVMVPGRYTLESAPLVIDGDLVTPGQTVDLGRGAVRIGGDRAAAATLRWGDHLTRPSYEWPRGRIFTDF